MGSLRAKLTKSAIDVTVQREIASAQHAIERAMRACRDTTPGPNAPAARLRRVVRDLGRVHHALSTIGSVANPFDASEDQDHMSEEDRSKQFWAAQAARRQAEEEARLRAEAEAEAEAEVGGGE